MKSKWFFGLCAAVVASLPAAASAIPSEFDYSTGVGVYYELPDLLTPYRTLPSGFDLPIITEIEVDGGVRTDSPITDIFIDNLPSVPSGITLDELLRLRAQYSRGMEAWGEEIVECLSESPRIVRVSTGSPVIINGSRGTLVVNANNRAVCQ
ncbi:MAG: hypothetical protein SXA11_24615 [Cyanobacteriota bacterium]|nr:hypothetical protein [Cyanobacteriota bacterium]